mmetsp:Transcript_35934/g.116324  ORF Transcript_35934/g.116324 Transcript_35934/m.116324 type:complete len:225 (-) Transcript_35934:164-838(-)
MALAHGPGAGVLRASLHRHGVLPRAQRGSSRPGHGARGDETWRGGGFSALDVGGLPLLFDHARQQHIERPLWVLPVHGTRGGQWPELRAKVGRPMVVGCFVVGDGLRLGHHGFRGGVGWLSRRCGARRPSHGLLPRRRGHRPGLRLAGPGGRGHCARPPAVPSAHRPRRAHGPLRCVARHGAGPSAARGGTRRSCSRGSSLSLGGACLHDAQVLDTPPDAPDPA